MPLAYGDGTIAEHRACRQDAVAFDVSHLGTVRVEGPEAFANLQSALTNDLAKVAPGRAQYTHLLDESDASVVDDIIVWWVDREVFDVMPNASNTDRVVAALGGEDTTADRSIIAVQGPRARQRAAAVVPEAAAVPRFGVRHFTWKGAECIAAGTGYTGEDGFEVAVPNDVAPDLWRALADTGVVPAGLGARDTLRLEAALPLHGHELGPGLRPCRPGSGGSWAGTRGSSAAVPHWPPSTTGGSPAGSSAWPPRAVSRPARDRPSWRRASPSESPPAATSRPCSSTGSHWPWSTPVWPPSRATRWNSSSGARCAPPPSSPPRSSDPGSSPGPHDHMAAARVVGLPFTVRELLKEHVGYLHPPY